MKTFADFMVELAAERVSSAPKIDATQVRKTARERSRRKKRENVKAGTQRKKDITMKKRKDDSAIGQSARNKVLKDVIPGYADLDPVQKAKKKAQKKDIIDRKVKREIPKVKRGETERIKKHKENLKTRPERKKAENEKAKKK